MTLLIDIRYRPQWSWLPEWNFQALRATYGRRYIWKKHLVNLNYGQPQYGIALEDDYQNAITELATLLLEGRNLILLCESDDEQSGHGRLMAQLIQREVERDDYLVPPERMDDLRARTLEKIFGKSSQSK